MDRNKLHLLHIRDATDQILKWANEISFDEFKAKQIYFDAILMQLIVLGEAANSLSDEFKKDHSDIPWHRAIGFRNQIAHGYLKIKPGPAWDTVKNDLPILRREIKKLLKEF